ncbi:MAG: hypothetical protein IJZ68_06765 [Bacteroidaceae bacterium]|nr:hypothetical protein [Bacteroidaceae bacterium]
MEQSSIDVRQGTLRASIKEFYTSANTPDIVILACAQHERLAYVTHHHTTNDSTPEGVAQVL